MPIVALTSIAALRDWVKKMRHQGAKSLHQDHRIKWQNSYWRPGMEWSWPKNVSTCAAGSRAGGVGMPKEPS